MTTPNDADPSAGPPREARLRPEFAALYPGVPPGTWLTAATLARQLLAGMVAARGSALRINARLMDDDHFEFRGGQADPRSRLYSRLTDR